MNEQVFLSYAREDQAQATELYELLVSHGLRVWFDVVDLPPGAKWKSDIFKAIRNSRYFCALLSSNSVSKTGFVQAELREGLELLSQHPDDDVYIIPVRLNDCQPTHEKLYELNWTDLFPSWNNGAQKLLRFLIRPELRFDGYYRCECGEIIRYLCFFGNGEVYSTFVKGHENAYPAAPPSVGRSGTRGHYEIDGNQIQFTTKNIAGEVSYFGTIEVEALILRFHSKINGNRGMWDYHFVHHQG